MPQAQRVKAPPKALTDQVQNRSHRTAYKVGNRRDIAIIELMVGDGLRIGEVESLNVSDIEVGDRKGVVTVRQGSKCRQVPLYKDIPQGVAALLAGSPLISANRSSQVRKVGGYPLVRFERSSKAREKVGLSDLTPHTLRHTLGTSLIRKHGVDLVTTAALIGHANISTRRFTRSRTTNRISSH